MSNFGLYSSYYDLLYAQKDYRGEAQYVIDKLQQFRPGRKNLLELGCGTAHHAAELVTAGHRVHGVDLSQTMLAAAEKRRSALPQNLQDQLSLEQGNIQIYRSKTHFDAVISLFHVFSYQTSNEALASSFATAAAHLQPNSLLAFDFWYGPAVLTQRPETRVRRLENAQTRVIRIAESALIENENRVEVTYTVTIHDKLTHIVLLSDLFATAR
jgi:SAM-dependent methyltransferase